MERAKIIFGGEEHRKKIGEEILIFLRRNKTEKEGKGGNIYLKKEKIFFGKEKKTEIENI